MLFFKTKQQKHDEEFNKAWEKINPFGKIEFVGQDKMTTLEIAETMSELAKHGNINSPAYILLEQELKYRVAKVQALPAYLSIIMTIVGIFLGWALSQYKPFELKTSFDIVAEHIQKHDKAEAERNAKQSTENITEIPKFNK